MSRLSIERSYDMRSGGFVQIPNHIARPDGVLSGLAVAVLVFLLSHTDGFDVTAESIARQLRNGRDAVRRAMRELSDVGYLEHSKDRGVDGLWQHRLTVRDTPVHAGQPHELETSSWTSGAGNSGAIKKTNDKKTNQKKGSSSVASLPSTSNIGLTEPSRRVIDALADLLAQHDGDDIDPLAFWRHLGDDHGAERPLAWARRIADKGQLNGLLRACCCGNAIDSQEIHTASKQSVEETA